MIVDHNLRKQSQTEALKVKEILKKNPSKKVFYGNAWTLKKVNNNIQYKLINKFTKILLKTKRILNFKS